jgi:EmrB/QacA subfamily drug resistance transporter
MGMLIFFRTLQGLTVGMEMALGLAIVTSVFPRAERGKAIGVYATSIALGLMLGPVLGGIVAQYWSWRFVFFINVPIACLSFLWGYWVIPEGKRIAGQRLDLPGALLAFVFLLSIMLYANRGETWGWFSPRGGFLLLCAALFGGLFFHVERKAPQPMLDLAIFKNRCFSFACLSSLLNFMAVYSVVFLTPWYLSDGLHYEVFAVGKVMTAFALLTFFVGPISGSLSDRIGSRGLAFCGMLVLSAGLALLSALGLKAGPLDVAWRLALCGMGAGMFQSPINSAAMGSAAPQFRGVASSILAVTRNTGMAFGIALAGAIMYGLAPFTTRSHCGPFTPRELGAFLDGLHWAFLAAAATALLAAFAALAARNDLPPPSDRRSVPTSVGEADPSGP